jgi:hypothetical protein
MDTAMDYVYENLPSHCIRVLELQPGVEDAPLACRLVTQSIPQIPYEAVSYVWGDPIRNQVIQCGERKLGLTSNLHEALVALRLRDRVRRLWADAICINQSDLEELGAQVSIMDLIFRRARSVIGWLGPGLGNAGIAIDYIIRFNHQPERFVDRFREQLPNDSTGDTFLAPGPDSAIWQSIKDFVELPYFHRVWIIQELGLAINARLLWGKHEITWPEVSKFCAFLDHKASFIVNHLQLKTWVVNHTSMIWLKLDNGELKHGFLQVLHLARIHQASDARDRIYAFLSHPSAVAGGSLIVNANYKMSAAELYTHFAMTVIERTKNLQILTLVDHDEVSTTSALPSWVPDWHAINRVAMTPGMRRPMSEEESDSHIAFVKSVARPILVVRGVVFDTVLAVSPVLDDKDFIVTTLGKEMAKNCPFFLDTLWHMLSTPPDTCLTVEEMLDRLSATLAAGLRKYLRLEGANLEQHRADFAAYLLMFDGIRPNGCKEGILASLPLAVRRDLEEMAADGNPVQYVQDISWMCMSRVVFRTTRHGIIGIGPRCMRPGDVCCSIAGSPMVMILRPVTDDGQPSVKGRYALVGPTEVSGLVEQSLKAEEILIV